jgi:hypothetical protein
MLKHYQQQALIRRLRQQQSASSVPTFPGAVAYGMTLGHYGTKPESFIDLIGEFAGAALPYGLAAAGVAALPVTAPLAAALTAGLNPVTRAAVSHGLKYGLAGVLTGAVRKAESGEERLTQMATESLFGAAGGALFGGLAARKLPKGGYMPSDIVENLPQGFMREPRLPKGAGMTRASQGALYPTGQFSAREQQMLLDLPSVGALREEAGLANRFVKAGIPELEGDVWRIHHHKTPKKTVDWLAREAEKRGVFFEFRKGAKKPYFFHNLKSRPMEFSSLDDSFKYMKKFGPLQETPDPFEVRNVLTGQSRRFKTVADARLALRSELGGGDMGQLSLFGQMTDEVAELAKRKGYEVIPDSGGFRVVGLGGHTQRMQTAEELAGFLKVRPDAQMVPSELYGVTEKMMYGHPLNEFDRSVLSLAKISSGGLPPAAGHGLTELPSLRGKGVFNVYRGLETPLEVAQAKEAIFKAGYETLDEPLKFQTGFDVPYFKKRNREVLEGIRWWTSLREKGPRGLGGLSAYFPTAMALGRLLGLDLVEQKGFAAQMAIDTTHFDKATLLKLGQISSPQQSGSPIVSAVTRDVMEGNMQLIDELATLTEGRNNLLNHLTESDRKLVMKVVQGESDFAKAPLKVQEAANWYREVMKDFAKRKQLPEWGEYATHVTDYDALWQAHRTALMNPGDRSKLIEKLGKDGYQRMLNFAEEYPRGWGSIPYNVRENLKANLFKWDVPNWEAIPASIRNRVPEEIFNPYMIARKPGSKVPYLDDIAQAFDHYVPQTLRDIHLGPVVKKWSPVINNMPGGNTLLSEKRYLERYVSTTVLNRPDAFSNLSRHIIENTNKTLGGLVGDSNWLHDMISLWRTGVYRGALGPDTAVINLTQSMNEWAAHGKFAGPALKNFVKSTYKSGYKGAVPKFPGLLGDVPTIWEAFPTGTRKGVIARAVQFSEKMTGWVLKPMAMTEWVNRGVAWNAAMEKYARAGYSFAEAMSLSSAQASSFMPPIAVSEASYRALYDVMRSQFGYHVTMIPPMFTNPLGRVSNLFLSYPIRQMEFLGRGIAEALQGYGVASRVMGPTAAQSVDAIKLLRFTALTGFMMTGPFVLARTIGVDASRVWGKGVVPHSLPFYKTLHNAYNSVVGDDPVDLKRSQRALFDSLATAAIPQYRYVKRISDADRNVARGFATDRLGRYIHDTSPAGELMALAGFKPQSYTVGREIAGELVHIARDYKYERREAIEEFLNKNDPSQMQKFMAKWGKEITPENIMEVMEMRQTTPEQRGAIGIPQDVLLQLMEEKPYLIRGLR